MSEKKKPDTIGEESLEKTSIVSSDTFRGRIAEAHSAPPCLILLVGPSAFVGKRWPLTQLQVVIGRSPDVFVSVEEKSVSRQHAILMIENGDVSIEDLNSSNKTEINGHQLIPNSKILLRNNDQIKAGNVIFKFLEKGNIEGLTAQQAYDRSQTDALTGIYNKGALLYEAPELIKKAISAKIPLSLVMFDIDFFKSINDTFGHPAGDYVLQEIARLVRQKLIRNEDFFARYGGEEFALILMHQGREKAQEIAERIRFTIERHPFVFQGQRIAVTVSLGISWITETTQNIDKILDRLIAEADQALYKSKKSGRNRVTISDKN